MTMTKARRLALAWILLAGGISIGWGFVLERVIIGGMYDYKGIYYGERCLLHHVDPYKLGEPLRDYQAEGGILPESRDVLRQNLTWYIYPPTTLIFMAPFAMLPWGPSHLLWMILIAGAIVYASVLMWSLAADYAPAISAGLICILLANSEILIATGNAAGIAVCLCIVAVWCFLKERYVLAGILCMAVGLAIKPHDAGLVWLYCLLAGGSYRKRALQTLVVIVVLGLVACLWMIPVAPHWLGELHFNLLAAEAPGGNSNPGPANPVYISCPQMIIDLQSVISAFRDDPRIYNPVSYLICGTLLLIWSVCTLRARFSPARAWLALAAVVPLTLLVSYHRPYDAKFLLLTVPACAMLWTEGGPIRWAALLATAAGILSTADIPLIILFILNKNLHGATAGLPGGIITNMLLRPTPLILLVMCVFYLWVYLRRAPARDATIEPGEPRNTQHALTRA